MRNVTFPILLLFMAGCGEQIDDNYSTYADAQRAGAIERGWIRDSCLRALANC